MNIAQATEQKKEVLRSWDDELMRQKFQVVQATN